MDDATRKVVEKIAKIFQLAEKNPNREEAAAAMAKGQEMLAAYNLDMTTIEKNSGESGKRLDEMVTGGMYKYQRQLWTNIAELNFCMYWSMLVRVKEGTPQAKRGRLFTHEHRLVGRQVNVIATKNMGTYLEGVITRLCIERMGDENRTGFYSSWAVAFREGIADAVIQKVKQRRRGQQEEEQRKADEAAERAQRAGISVATALTIAGVKEAEKIANYDFLHGEGAWARGKKLVRSVRSVGLRYVLRKLLNRLKQKEPMQLGQRLTLKRRQRKLKRSARQLAGEKSVVAMVAASGMLDRPRRNSVRRAALIGQGVMSVRRCQLIRKHQVALGALGG